MAGGSWLWMMPILMTRSSQNSLLKILEEPPEKHYWFWLRTGQGVVADSLLQMRPSSISTTGRFCTREVLVALGAFVPMIFLNCRHGGWVFGQHWICRFCTFVMMWKSLAFFRIGLILNGRPSNLFQMFSAWREMMIPTNFRRESRCGGLVSCGKYTDGLEGAWWTWILVKIRIYDSLDEHFNRCSCR